MLRILILAIVFAIPAAAESQELVHALSPEQARQELDLVVEAILAHHPNPFHVTTREQFDALVNTLAARQDPVPVATQYFDLMKVCSLVNDTHTQLHITADTPGFRNSFPLRFRLFPDGLYVIAADRKYREMIGQRVDRIGGVPALEVVERLAQHAPADNWPRKRVFAEVFFYLPESYHYLDLTDDSGYVSLELVDSNQIRSTVTLEHTWDRGYTDFSWDAQNPFVPADLITAHEALGGIVPLYQQRLDDNYWYRFLDEERRYLYLQINRQFDKSEGQPAIEFHLQWARDLLDSAVEVMIIDLRNDPGGTVNIGNPVPALLSGIYFAHPTLRGVAVLFGTDTVSAGTILIGQLEDTIRPVLIGAPSGSSPNMYLNAIKRVLPHSQLQLEVSQDIYVTTREADNRPYIAPDIPMAASFEDFLAGRDPLLDYAKTVDKPLRQKLYDSASPYDPWQRDSQVKALPVR